MVTDPYLKHMHDLLQVGKDVYQTVSKVFLFVCLFVCYLKLIEGSLLFNGVNTPWYLHENKIVPSN